MATKFFNKKVYIVPGNAHRFRTEHDAVFYCNQHGIDPATIEKYDSTKEYDRWLELQKMQADAENYLANLQQSIQNELNQSQIQLLDSIDNFMKDYAKKKGFDMVLRKSATLFIDEKYDVTDEVIEGLNKRYNKVGGKTAAPAPAKTEAAPAKPAAGTTATGLSTEKPATPGKVELKK